VPIATQFIELIQKNGASMKTITKPKVDHTPAVLDEVSKLLLAAAAEMERLGHARREMQSCDGSVCIQGALGMARFGNGTAIFDELCSSAYSRVRANLGGSPMSWNDEHGRTKDQVVAKLRAVALRGE
jgi:hypothetical protein